MPLFHQSASISPTTPSPFSTLRLSLFESDRLLMPFWFQFYQSYLKPHPFFISALEQFCTTPPATFQFQDSL